MSSEHDDSSGDQQTHVDWMIDEFQKAQSRRRVKASLPAVVMPDEDHDIREPAAITVTVPVPPTRR